MTKVQIPRECMTIVQGRVCAHNEALTVAPSEDLVRIRMEGASGTFAGIDWSRYRYLVLDMLSDMDAETNLHVYFEKEQPDPGEQRNYLMYQMIPGRRVRLALDLNALHSEAYFLLTQPGMLKGMAHCKPCDISEMRAVEIEVHSGYSRRFSSVSLFDVFLADSLPEMKVCGEPMVDELGQWRDKEWKNKTHSMEELREYLLSERQKARAASGYPEGWSRYGGWLKKKFDATGYFHTHFDGNRWWLVDPDGFAFFSNGMCYGSRMGVYGFTDRMENLFSWLPDDGDPDYRDAWTTADKIPEFAKRNGVEAGKKRRMFNFARANMIRVFGPEQWWDAWTEIQAARLKSWGFNTIGVGVNNYEDEHVEKFLRKAEIPFVLTLKNFPLTKDCIYRDFPDVFSQEYRDGCARFAEQLLPYADSPYLIGYFITNEPEWRFQADVNPAERVFASSKPLASKDALISVLHKKYGSITRLNQAWNTHFASFDDMKQPFDHADIFSEQAASDFVALREILLREYSRVPDEALKRAAPHHMDLGMRYNHISSNEIAGSEFFNLVSFNCYFPSPAQSLEIVRSEIDKPCVIGEWHIGGGDGGLLSCGLLASATQEERGRACEYYMQQAMSARNCVGLHYFEMNDQPLLGRFDGECMQHGVVDVCCRPYDELISHFRSAAESMYAIVSGEASPSAAPATVYRPK